MNRKPLNTKADSFLNSCGVILQHNNFKSTQDILSSAKPLMSYTYCRMK